MFGRSASPKQALKPQTLNSTQVNLAKLLLPHFQPGSKGQGCDC